MSMTVSQPGKTCLPLVLALGLAPAAWGAEPVAVANGPTTVAPGQVIFLDAGGSKSDEPIVWNANPPKVKISRLTVEDEVAGGFAIVRDAPAGVYVFTATAIGTPEGKRITASTASVVVTVRSDAPPPKPPTPPQPTPGPDDPVVNPDYDPDIVIVEAAGRLAAAPIPGDTHLYATFIADPDTFTPALAALQTMGGLDSLNAHLRSYGSDDPDLTRYGLLAPAKFYGLPCVLVQRPDGKIVAAVKNPTREKVLKALRTLRKGGK